MIRVIYRGRLGNNLFQYCLGRILSTELQLNLQADPIAGFPRTGATRRRWLPLLTRRVRTLTGHEVDLDAVLADRGASRIVVDGFFQRYEYYRGFKDVIRNEWLRADERLDVGSEDLTISVRSGDIWQAEGGLPPHPDLVGLPFSFYRRIVEGRSWARVHVVTNDPSDLMVRKLVREFDADVKSGGTLADFAFLRSSTHIVASVSSFCWWAAWLSDAASIHFPVLGLLSPAVRPDVDLRVDDEERYVYHVFQEEQLPWTGGPEQRRRLLKS